MKRRFTILLDPDPDAGGYTVTAPALPGCITEGDTYEEALAMAQEAILAYLESLQKHGDPIPAEQPPLQMTTVEVEFAEGQAGAVSSPVSRA